MALLGKRWLSMLAVLALGQTLVSCESSPGALPEAPAIPVGLTAVPGNASVVLSWTENTESNMAGYDVYQGTVTGELVKIATATAPAATYTVTGLTNGTSYFFALKAVNNANNSSELCAEVVATPSEPDATPPTVSMTQPAPTTDVALEAGVTLAFSENMSPATVIVSFTPTLALAATNWSDGKTLVLQPETLSQNTTYTVAVEGNDLAGNPLGGTKSFSFGTTNTLPPEVLSNSPASGATGVPSGANIAFVFSKPMNHASVEGAFSASPSIVCAWAWSADSKLATCTHSDLTASTSYTITLGTGAQDQATTPHPLAAAVSFTFTTASAPDTTKPVVCPSTGGTSPCPSTSATAPAAGAIGIYRATHVVVKFSEPMDKASAQTAFSVTSPPGHNAGIFSWNSAGDQMTFNPDADFAYGDNVTWTVSTAAKDLANNTLSASFTSSFRAIRQDAATLYSQSGLDGYVYSNGTVYSSLSSVAVGDVASNLYPRGFLSFDLGSLPTTLTSITSAYLNVYQSAVIGSPYSNLGGAVRAESVAYGASLTYASAFETPILKTSQCSLLCNPICHWVCNTLDEWVTLSDSTAIGLKSVGVLRKISDDWANRTSRGSRAQFRLRFPTNTDADGVADFVQFISGDSTSDRPALQIIYEYP